MVDLEIIEQEILSLEAKDTSFAVVERLAWLYIVKDHLRTTQTKKLTEQLSGDEFKEACSSVPVSDLINIFDELMLSIQLTYPKEYESILKKIRALK